MIKTQVSLELSELRREEQTTPCLLYAVTETLIFFQYFLLRFREDLRPDQPCPGRCLRLKVIGQNPCYFDIKVARQSESDYSDGKV